MMKRVQSASSQFTLETRTRSRHGLVSVRPRCRMWHAAVVWMLLLSGCSSTARDPHGDDAMVGGDASDDDAMTLDDAGEVVSPECPSVIALHDSMGAAHVANNNGVIYNSNPPSSGPHCDPWGRYAIFSASNPLPRCNYIHNLEHGAVVLLYKCDAACPEVVAALTAVRDSIVDAQCPAAKRVIITPDADIDTPIAAAAWQRTWHSDCANESAFDSLTTFIRANLGSAGLGPEGSHCGDGSVAP